MTPQEADKIIAEYMNDFSCYDCEFSHEESTGPRYYHSSMKCGKEGFYFEDIDECGQFQYNQKKATYSKSLDALVPVWEKLNSWDYDYDMRFSKNVWTFSISNYFINERAVTNPLKENGVANTIQEAAAIATARAIKELKQ